LKFTVIDLETTGLDPKKDKIIEIGLIQFKHKDYKDTIITGSYGSLQDPETPLEEIITDITGLTDSALEGEAIDWTVVSQMLASSELIIAHNAAFDKSFLQKVPELNLKSTPWACSMKHIDWGKHGFKTRSLNYLACDHGFVNPFPHRALFDCATTYKLIEKYLEELHLGCQQKEYRVAAVGASFSVKDNLKRNGYRWDPNQRVWFKTLMEKTLENERKFLEAEIYQGNTHHTEELISDRM